VKISLLSLNTWQERGPWEKRWQVIFDGIKKLNPDLLAFQELFKPEWAEAVKLRTGKSQLAVFPEHSSGLVLLTHLPAETKEIIRYETKSPNEEYFRYAVFSRIATPSGSLHLVNTHLSWQPEDARVRKEQMRELCAWITSKGDAPAIVTGDFNSDAGSPELEVMFESGFLDAYAVCCPGKEKMTWSHRNLYTHSEYNKRDGELLPERRIDFIFFRPAGVLSVVGMEVVFDTPSPEAIWASDHYGLFAQFRMNRSPA